ncbi:MAG: lipoyl(octanoyl) transferase LipB [Pseudomonadota bacterium]|nr:lipoyl(octanoyl) transferase LipB [Pseudomonadota bacterium]
MKHIPIKELGLQHYSDILNNMYTHIAHNKPCEIWVLEHYPIYTKGRRSLDEHFLTPTHIPIIDTDRGGQVTYHGPGQMIIYPILQLKIWQLSPLDLVCILENTTITALKSLGIPSTNNLDARGVYIHNNKVGSIGLKIKSGYSYHGMAINIDMDLSPFDAIIACGDQDIKLTNISSYSDLHSKFKHIWLNIFVANLVTKRYTEVD